MFGFHSKFGADLAAAAAVAATATASCSFVPFRVVSCLNGYPGIKTSVGNNGTIVLAFHGFTSVSVCTQNFALGRLDGRSFTCRTERFQKHI